MDSTMEGSLHGCQSVEAEYSSYVAKLFDNDEFLGTFTFIEEKIGVIDFHVVFSTKDECILQDSLILKIGGVDMKVEHLVSYPHYDMSFFKLLGEFPSCKCFEIGYEPLSIGDDVMLISFPALAEGDYNSELPVVSHGKIEQVVSSPKNSFLLAKYECYPGSSGGPIVLKRTTGKLVGIHIGSVYHEDTSYNAPASLTPRQPDYPVECGTVHGLSWKPPTMDVDLEALSEGSSNNQEGEQLEVSVSDALDTSAAFLQDVREVAFYAASNAVHKGHHAYFLPASTVKTLISVEPFVVGTLGGSTSKHVSRRQELRRKTLDKPWRKQMRRLHRMIRAIKGKDNDLA